LYNENLRSGLGDFSNAYSNKGSDGTPYRLGIRPMPGITSVDIKPKGAYGSLREATVNFVCWDIKQLEDLELLYMRPGYTVLLEWGWSPFLNNKKALVTSLDYTDIINQKWSKEELFKRQYARATDGKYKKEDGTDVSIIGYEGNCESMFGTIKNYSWKARMDGGYDCQTSIISIGEVIESLKINYAPVNSNSSLKISGLLTPNIKTPNSTAIDSSKMEDLAKTYNQNILAGIFYELREIVDQVLDLDKDDTQGTSLLLTDIGHINPITKSNITYNVFRKTLNIVGGDAEASSNGSIGKSDEQVYITLESLVHLLNNYVVLRDKTNNKPYLSLSVYEKNATTINDISGEGYLLALAHPLQISIDPTICLIKNQLWIDGINIKPQTSAVSKDGKPVVAFAHNLKPAPYASTPEEFVKTIIRNTIPVKYINPESSKEKVAKFINDYLRPGGNTTALQENIKEVTKAFDKLYSTYKIQPPTLSNSWGLKYSYPERTNKTLKEVALTTNTFYDLLEDTIAANLDTKEIDRILGGSENRKEIADSNNIVADEQEKIIEQQEEIEEKRKDAIEGSKYLKNIDKPYYLGNEWKTELGIIGNIYVNLNMLYNMCVDPNLAAQDKKEKNEIALYDFIKNVLSKISYSIGDVNNFELFVEPDGDVARIIDINFVDRTKSPSKVYEDAFLIELQNLNSIARSYSIESKIFPEQSTTVAIGAQVEGGALGIDTTSLVDFNRSIIDRIIPVKDMPTSPSNEDAKAKISQLTESLQTLYEYFASSKSKWIFSDGNFDANEVGKYQGALRDLINFFRSIGKTSTKSKSIIPTTLSIEMDGIGGIVIGNIFRISLDILPKGYKGDGSVGSKIGYGVTGLEHSIQNNDWITKIDSQFILLDEPQGEEIDFTNLIVSSSPPSTSNTSTSTSGGTTIVLQTSSTGEVKPVTVSVNKNSGKALDEVEKACKKQGITNPLIILAIKGNILKESQGKPIVENLNYSTTPLPRVRNIFGNRVSKFNDAELKNLTRNITEFADTIYGLKSGQLGKSLGNTVAGDGYKFRGRGYIQITGRKNYEECGKALNKDFINNPDSINNPENAADAAVWFLKRGFPSIKRSTGIDPNNPPSQAEANRFVTSVIAGRALKRPDKSAYYNELLTKVDAYVEKIKRTA